MVRPTALRVIDFGSVTPLRSQTLWHAVADGVSEGAPPTLSFARPSAAYVSTGYLRAIDEVDRTYCRRAGLPVFRRMVGGGPVYLDRHQLFFQLTVPAAWIRGPRVDALRRFLAPAVAAFRAVGIPAELDAAGEIVVGDAKICGHGAGQVGEAVLVVGNLIERFDYRRAARILRAPDPEARRLVEALMRRFIRATPADAERFKQAARAAYGAALGLSPKAGCLTPGERRRLGELDRTFETEAWRRGPGGVASPIWRVKIRAGVLVGAVEIGEARLTAAVVHDRLVSLRIADGGPGGDTSALEAATLGLTLSEAAARLSSAGATGRRAAAALAAFGRVRV